VEAGITFWQVAVNYQSVGSRNPAAQLCRQSSQRGPWHCMLWRNRPPRARRDRQRAEDRHTDGSLVLAVRVSVSSMLYRPMHPTPRIRPTVAPAACGPALLGPGDAEFSHFLLQGRALHPQAGRGPLRSGHYPTGLPEGAEDVLPLGLGQRLGGMRGDGTDWPLTPIRHGCIIQI